MRTARTTASGDPSGRHVPGSPSRYLSARTPKGAADHCAAPHRRARWSEAAQTSARAPPPGGPRKRPETANDAGERRHATRWGAAGVIAVRRSRWGHRRTLPRKSELDTNHRAPDLPPVMKPTDLVAIATATASGTATSGEADLKAAGVSFAVALVVYFVRWLSARLKQ